MWAMIPVSCRICSSVFLSLYLCTISPAMSINSPHAATAAFISASQNLYLRSGLASLLEKISIVAILNLLRSAGPLPIARTLMPATKRGVRAPATAHANMMPSDAESDSVPPIIKAPSPASCLKAARMLNPASTAAAADQARDSEAQDSPQRKRETVVSRTPAVSLWLHDSSALYVTGARQATATTNHATDTNPRAPIAMPYWPAIAPQEMMRSISTSPVGSSEMRPTPVPWMNMVAAPVMPAAATERVGDVEVAVKYEFASHTKREAMSPRRRHEKKYQPSFSPPNLDGYPL
mmetsp:Transcript_40656/g.95053  ORF Transcript_40656/g.95053 Transcript_40656/m.95053 type:complete len:293 (-) Transcript_40656:1423-2301(-)